MLFNALSILPGLSEILSHSELIPNAAFTLTRKRYNEHSILSKKLLPGTLNPEPIADYSSAVTSMPQTAMAKLWECLILIYLLCKEHNKIIRQYYYYSIGSSLLVTNVQKLDIRYVSVFYYSAIMILPCSLHKYQNFPQFCNSRS